MTEHPSNHNSDEIDKEELHSVGLDEALAVASFAFHDALYRQQVTPEEDKKLRERMVAASLESVTEKETD